MKKRKKEPKKEIKPNEEKKLSFGEIIKRISQVKPLKE